ncbi:hypothetical protein [Bradyrhizobium sp. Ash2021]|uniref:hypothetical protein n=1 Tax=Bradyrhizobium sp. Ash2021 TaxID=2954771 RepID=UPI0028162D3E|nr:hypothetical protein [Bradyrhizobium sp. Ash2021]WMT73381.1 Spy/CpxP family protein refolding chaperone [Bradyrhizobium sp. Ash2021]
MIGQIQAMDTRLDAMSSAVKTILPALEAFCTSRSDDQKAKFDSGEGRGRFWRWHGWDFCLALSVDWTPVMSGTDVSIDVGLPGLHFRFNRFLLLFPRREPS